MKTKLGNYISEYSVRNKFEENIPVYSVTNTQGFCRDYFGKEVASKDKSTYKIVPKGCFAYNPSRINVGSVDWQRSEERVIVSPLYNVFSVSEELDNQYLYYFLKSDIALRLIKNTATGSVRDNLKFNMLCDFPINMPSLEKQKEIVRCLDKVAAITEHHQQELCKMDELVKSRFIELFSGTFEIVSAEDVCSDIVDCPHSTPKYDEIELTYPAIRTSEIQNGSISWDSMKYVGVIEYEKRVKRLKPERGDVVYAREGTYGDCVILPDEYKFCLGQRTMLFRPNYKICTSAYLHAALRSDAVKKQADESNAGSTVPHVNVADAKKFHFPLPPLELQQQFAAFVEQVDKSKLAVQKGLQELETLKKSLMQQYFG